LNRPKNTFAYRECDIFDLAAAYAYGLAKNHPFVDGNKRIALAVSRTFLLLNGYGINATQQEKFQVYYNLAASELGENQTASWSRQHACPVT